VNFPFICSNIPAAPAHGVYIYLSWYDILELVSPIRISLRVAANEEATEPRLPLS
jgi:hypothetical protein